MKDKRMIMMMLILAFSLLLTGCASDVQQRGDGEAITFTDMTGRSDLYESNGAALTAQIQETIESGKREDPDYIFVIYMGGVEEGKAQMHNSLSSNPIWETLQAIKNDRYHFLEK